MNKRENDYTNTVQKIILYVSPEGCDKWSGELPEPDASMSDGPLRTIQTAQMAVRKLISSKNESFDIKVLIRQGRYEVRKTIVFGLEDSGTENNRVFYEAYPGERPIFSGAIEVQGWHKLDHSVEGLSEEARKNIWAANIPAGVDNFHILYQNGKPLQRARGKGFKPTVSGYWKDPQCWQKGSRTELHFPEGALRNWQNIEDVEIVIRPWCLWTMNILPLKSVDMKNCIAHTGIEGSYFLSRERYNRFPEETVWPENIPEGLTGPGRWMVNTRMRKIYLWPQDNQRPENITVPGLRELLRVEGIIKDNEPEDIPVEYISFRGLTFTEGDRDRWMDSHKGVQHDWEMWDQDNALVRLRGAENCEISGCTFGPSGGTGIRLDLHCRYNRIEGNKLENLGATGIFLGGYGAGTKNVNNNNMVTNNTIHDCGKLYWHSMGILVHQSGENIISHNLLYNLPYSGIVLAGIRPGFLRKEVREAVKTGDLDFDRSFMPIIENMRTQSLREICTHIRWDEVTVFEGEDFDEEMALTLPFVHARQNIVEYNEIHDIMQVLGDGNGIYISDCGPYNVLRYNRIYNMTHAFGVGIRTDAWQRDTLVEGNIVHDCRGGLAVSKNNIAWNNVIAFIRSTEKHSVDDNEEDEEVFSPIYYHLDRARGFSDGIIERNICYHAGEYPIRFNLERINRDDGKQLVDYNIFFWREHKEDCLKVLDRLREHGFDKNSAVQDPGFINTNERDFRLRPDSAAKKMGIKSLPQEKIGIENKWKDINDHSG